MMWVRRKNGELFTILGLDVVIDEKRRVIETKDESSSENRSERNT